MTSLMSLTEIKWKIRPKLDTYYYYLWPTPLRAIRTAKVGWLYMAHPDLTHRAAIVTALAPLIKDHTSKEIELQVVSEVESIDTPNNQVKQRVLVIQGPYDDNDTLKTFFNAAFSKEGDINIGYLSRYTFVPS